MNKQASRLSMLLGMGTAPTTPTKKAPTKKATKKKKPSKKAAKNTMPWSSQNKGC
jgi:hypothetical protein